MDLFWEALSGVGMACIELSYAPQILRLHRRKVADDISLAFPGLNLFGRTLAAMYAVHMGAEVLAAGFMVGMAMRTALLVQVLYYRSMAARAERLAPASLPKEFVDAAA